MLSYKLTKANAGIELWGDAPSLDRLHRFIHRIVEDAAHIENKEGLPLHLAYDIRKAMQGYRLREMSGESSLLLYGVEILWTDLLVQIAVLRASMAFIPTNKLDQSIMFELEFVVESAVREALPIVAESVFCLVGEVGMVDSGYLNALLNSRGCYLISLPAGKRLQMLPRILETFTPMYLHRYRTPIESDYIPIEIFEDFDLDEWPEFDW